MQDHSRTPEPKLRARAEELVMELARHNRAQPQNKLPREKVDKLTDELLGINYELNEREFSTAPTRRNL